MFTRAVVLLLVLSSTPLLAAEDIGLEAQQFVDANSTLRAELAWFDSWKKSAAQTLKDNPSISGEEKCADACLLRYLMDIKRKNKDKEQIRLTPEERLEVCRYYLLYQRNGWVLPEAIQAYVTRENVFEVAVVPKK